ncbi:hypothetical protein [Nostoc sp. CMAA1605]|uniref:hypothetical protein n=1 Tax=Nostoc sp. CMAA1605 TaxID=2055159 RepID=UPI001F315283|nr:hypothetical protein [Nostoc sp. CMAA1605]MCF4966404.1 hypothetical protein [Nostoc sp. CMAA1605]
MFSQTIASDLLTDLSTDEQQVLAGGYGRYRKGCGYGGGSGVGSTEESTSGSVPFRGGRLAIGFIITATPFSKCLNGYSGTNGDSGTDGGGVGSGGED